MIFHDLASCLGLRDRNFSIEKKKNKLGKNQISTESPQNLQVYIYSFLVLIGLVIDITDEIISFITRVNYFLSALHKRVFYFIMIRSGGD